MKTDSGSIITCQLDNTTSKDIRPRQKTLGRPQGVLSHAGVRITERLDNLLQGQRAEAFEGPESVQPTQRRSAGAKEYSQLFKGSFPALHEETTPLDRNWIRVGSRPR